MTRQHAVAVSALLGTAAVAGVLALGQTLQLGQAAHGSSDSQVKARAATLHRAEAQIAKLNASVPPAPKARQRPAAVPAEQVVYVRATAPSRPAGGEYEAEEADQREGEHDD